MTNPLIIAIDGPAASGKGTLARRIAEHYGLAHLDTGLTYRAVAHLLLSKNLPLDSEPLAVEEAARVDWNRLEREVLSIHAVGEAASKIAVFPALRRVLVEKQRQFARNALHGAVLDGRDVGTVVCPDADVKIFLTASAPERARRRLAEIEANGGEGAYAAILADIERRDRRDAERQDSPLCAAADAHLLDTSEMGIDAAFLAARAVIDRARPTKAKA
ncbi:MAG TPA: (d)CMP kinase [Mesorhizobium sp.]|jgi:cytidylate kinase|nr:(d)CMP kinase [Mesorhizobium sp.]